MFERALLVALVALVVMAFGIGGGLALFLATETDPDTAEEVIGWVIFGGFVTAVVMAFVALGKDD